MTWSKKHFEGIAGVIRMLPEEGNSRRDIVRQFISLLRSTNKDFDEERFAEAALGGAL